MPCLLGCLALITPRLVIVGLFLFSQYLHAAYDTWVWPVLGFFFLPVTVLGFAVAQNEFREQPVFWWATVIVAVLLDLGAFGGGSWGVQGRRH